MDDIFTKARVRYLSYLNKGGIEPDVNMGGFRPQADSFLPRSSQMGLCPLAYANQKYEVEPAHPELLTENQPNLLHLFRSGNQCAREWTQTMVWYAAKYHPDWKIQVEVPCDDSLTTGTIDMLLTIGDTKVVIDWKRTGQTAITERATGLVHGHHNFQQLADYCRKITKLYPDHRVIGALLRDYRSFWRVFWLEGDKDAPYSWSIFCNDKFVGKADTLSLYRVAAYLNKDTSEVPYNHPLTHWQCAQKVRGNVYKARCPYWGNCWKLPEEVDFTDGLYNGDGEFYGLETSTS